MKRPQPEREARDLLARYYVSRAPVPVEDIAGWMHAQIARAANTTDTTVGFLWRAGDSTILGVDSRRSARRQRWVVAHLLGHWLIGADRELTIDHGLPLAESSPAAASLEEEAAANAFAAELLMPGTLVDAAVRRQLAGAPSREVLLRRLAAEFDVSTEVVTWRLLNLGVLT